MILEFEIHDLPKLPNATLYKHWRVKHTEANKWKSLVLEQCVMAGKTQLGLTSAALSFERHSSREPDFDSLVMSFKHVCDGLVLAGVIKDDKSSVIGQPSYKWIKAKQKDSKIKVRVEGVA
jgi:hypothetical protein